MSDDIIDDWDALVAATDNGRTSGVKGERLDGIHQAIQNYTRRQLDTAEPKKKRGKKSRTDKNGNLLEFAIQGDIVKALKKMDNVTDIARTNSGRVQSQGRWINLSPAGTADLHCTLNGVLRVAIEVKRIKPRTKATDKQEKYLVAFAKTGGLAMIARSADEVRELLAVGEAGDFIEVGKNGEVIYA